MTRRTDPSTPQQKVAALREELAERGPHHRVSILDVLACLAEIDRLEKLLSGRDALEQEITRLERLLAEKEDQ